MVNGEPSGRGQPLGPSLAAVLLHARSHVTGGLVIVALAGTGALAPADQRAALSASIYVVSYLAFSLPAIAAGAAVGRFGLERTTTVYGIVVAFLAAAATLRFWLQGHHRRAAAVTAVQHHLPACPGTVATRTRS
jgi:hypothetical protein